MKKIIVSTMLAVAVSISASATVTNAVHDDGFGLHLSYPAIHTNKASTTTTLNKFIRFYVDDATRLYESNRYDDVSMTYNVTFENERYVSVVLRITCQGQHLAQPESYAYGLIFDKFIGDRADLSAETLFPSPSSILKSITNKEYSLQNDADVVVPYDSSFKPMEMVNNFYLTKDGHLAMMYQRGDVAPYSEGHLHVVLPIVFK